MAKKSVKKKGRVAKAVRPKKVATKKGGKTKKVVAGKKAGTARKVVTAKKTKKASPKKVVAKKSVKKVAPKAAMQKTTTKPRRPTKAKPAAKSVKTSQRTAPKPKTGIAKPMAPMVKAPAEPSTVVPELKAATSVMPEAGKAAKFEVEPPPQSELDDEEELVEDIDDVSEEIEEEVEEELGLDSQDDDVDYLEKSEDLLDDTDEYRNN